MIVAPEAIPNLPISVSGFSRRVHPIAFMSEDACLLYAGQLGTCSTQMGNFACK